jgi:hypothetical protein
MKLRQMIAAGAVLVLGISAMSRAAMAPQDVKYRLAHANGQGTLKVGQEQFNVNGVIVKLLDDRKAELTLISDITFFISGTWSQNAESQDDFDLQISGGANPGGLDGVGKVTLGNSTRSDLRLTLKGKSRTTKKNIEVQFVGK